MTAVIDEITDTDLPDVGRFLNRRLNKRVDPDAWVRASRVPWTIDAPNHGYLLRDGDDIVGACLAFYSRRDLGGGEERFCNLGAWCVEPGYRFQGLKLVKAVLAQDGYTFTDLSPSGSVVPLNQRLGFRFLDTTTALVPCVPWPTVPALRRDERISVTSKDQALRQALKGRDLDIYRDHVRTAAALHVLIRRGSQTCYVILRRDRRKNLPLFASVLHVSDPELLHASGPQLSRYLLLRHGVLALLAELRVVSRRPRHSILLDHARPKMFRSSRVTENDVDYLYSELMCISW